MEKTKAKKITLPYAVRTDYAHLLEHLSKEAYEKLPPLVKQWRHRILGSAGREPTHSTGRSYSTTMTIKMHTALTEWAKDIRQRAKDFLAGEGRESKGSFAVIAADSIIQWLKKIEFGSSI